MAVGSAVLRRLVARRLPEALRFPEILAALGVFASQVGERPRQGEEMTLFLLVSRGLGGDQAALDPAARLLRATRFPGGPRRRQERLEDPVGFPFALEHPQRGAHLPERAVHVARHLQGGGEQGARLAFDRGVAFPFLIQELEGDLDGPDRLLGAEGLDRTPGVLEAVLHRLPGDVAFGAVIHELRIDPLELAGVPLLELLGVLAVQRSPPAARHLGVEHLAHDAAGEGERVAPRLALLLDEPSLDELLHRLFDVGVGLAERLEIAEVEGLAHDGGGRQDLAQRLGEAGDALLHRLLDGGGQGVRRDLGASGEGPGAGDVADQVPRVHQRAHQLLGEIGIPFGALEQPLRDAVGDLGAAGEGRQQLPVLGGRQAAQGDMTEVSIALEALDHRGERVTAADLLRSEGADDQGRGGPETAHDVAQRLDGDVGAVQVLQQQHEGLPGLDADEGARQELEDLGAVLGLARFACRRRRRVTSRSDPERIDLAERREQGQEIGGQIREIRPRVPG
jgi:hypothetical protein